VRGTLVAFSVASEGKSSLSEKELMHRFTDVAREKVSCKVT
jgi:hypothetical protein